MTKKTKKILTAAILLVLAAQFCGASAIGENAEFSTIRGRDWVLQEVRTASQTVKIDRANTANGNSVYTIRFDAERIGGTGAPNRYFAPYTASGARGLSIGLIAGTLMAPLFERTDLRERDYFNYLQKVFRWNLLNGKLELHTLDEKGMEVILFFSE